MKIVKQDQAKCDYGEIVIDAETPWCEYCGNLEKHTPIISDGDTWLCEDCFEEEKTLTA